MSTLFAIVVGIALVVGLGISFFIIGDKWAARSPTGHGDFFPTLHLAALVAALVGGALAWMAFASDHPQKWRHLTLPFVFAAIVYGYALGINRSSWRHLILDIRARVRRKNAV
jgi:hypothetical protein